MTQECANCPKCHKVGFLIHPALYSVGLKYEDELAGFDSVRTADEVKADERLQTKYGKEVPPLSGKFKATDKEGGKEINLGSGAQYTLRLIRKGFVYFYNEKDMIAPLRCYEVSENGLLTDTTTAYPPCGKQCERRDVACNPHKNQVTARLLTIPDAEQAKEVWVSFSDTKWTPEVEKLHKENPEYRSEYMRKVRVSEWIKNEDLQHEHAVNLHKVDVNNPIIAEYAVSNPEAFSFSFRKYNETGLGLDLKKAKQLFKEIASTEGMEKLDRLSDKEISSLLAKIAEDKGIRIKTGKPREFLKKTKEMGMHEGPIQDEMLADLDVHLDCMRQDNANRATLRGELLSVNPFQHLLNEVERFYDRKHDGNQKNAAYRGKTMILALDDPAGIAQDLNGLIIQRQEAFAESKKYRRPAKVGMCIQNIRNALLGHVAQQEAVKDALENAGSDIGIVQPISTPIQSRAVTKLSGEKLVRYEQIVDGNFPGIQEKFDKEWEEKYEIHLKRDGARYEEYKQITTVFEEYKNKFVTPLAEAHVKWMESDRMFHCFSRNFDSGTKGAESGKNLSEAEAAEADSKSAIEQSTGYVALFSRCVGRTPMQPVCMDLYVKWLTEESPDEERNLLWRALTLNQSALSDCIKKACSDQEKTVEALASLSLKLNASFVTSDPAQQGLWAQALPLLRNWSFTWWDAHSEVQKRLHAAFSIDAKDKINDWRASRRAFAEAKKLSEEMAGKMDEIVTRMHALDTRQTELGKLLHVDKSNLVMKSKEYQQLAGKLLEAGRAATASLNNAMGRLLQQMQGPLGRAAAKKDSGFFKRVEALVSYINGTPTAGPKLKGTAKAVGKVIAADYVRGGGRYGWGAFTETLASLPDTPNARMTVRLPGTMSRRLLMESMLMDVQMPHFKVGYVRLAAGTLEINALDAVGSKLWHIDEPYFRSLAHLQQLQENEARLSAEVEEAKKSVGKAQEAMKDASAERDSHMKEYHRETQKQAMHQEALNKARKEIDMRRADVRGLISEKRGWERFDARLWGYGWPTLNGVLAGWCYLSLKEAFDRLGPRLGPNDKQYDEAVSTLFASGLVVVAAATEMAHKGLSAAGVGSMKWAPGLKDTPNVQAKGMKKLGTFSRVIGPASGSVASAVFGYWDWQKRKEAKERGDTYLAAAYLVSVGLAGAAVVLGFFAIFAGLKVATWAVIASVAYAVFSSILSAFEPDKMQQWLQSCYFGKYPERFDEGGEALEMGEYQRLGFAPIT